MILIWFVFLCIHTSTYIYLILIYLFFQNAFLEFIRIEMIFHAKAIELYSKSFNIVKEIKIEEDLHVSLLLLYNIF